MKFLTAIGMAVLVLSGIMKLLDLGQFSEAIKTWSIIPTALAPIVVIVVPTAELLLGGAWLLGFRRTGAAVGALILVALFALGISVQLLTGKPPNCGCMGLIEKYHESQRAGWWHLGWNAALATCFVPGVWPTRVRPDPKSTIAPAEHADGGRGFTLIEVLLSILIVFVLLALVVPSIGRAGAVGRQSVSLGNLRSHVQIFDMYQGQYKDYFPFYTDPRASYSVLRAGTDVVQIVDYFEMATHWNIALADEFYEANPRHLSFFPPGETNGVWTGYYYASACLADPLFWNPLTRTGPEQWRATRGAEVLFPSSKGLFFIQGHGTVRVSRRVPGLDEVGFVDGSAMALHEHQLTAPYFNGEGFWPGTRFGNGIHVLHTIDGVRGRDRE